MGVRIPSADGVGPLVSGLYYRAALHLQDSSGRLGVLPKVTQQLGPDSVSESRCGGLCQDPPPPHLLHTLCSWTWGRIDLELIPRFLTLYSFPPTTQLHTLIAIDGKMNLQQL